MESVWKVKIPAKLPSDKNAFLFDKPDGEKVKVMLTENQQNLRKRLIDGNQGRLGPISGRKLVNENNSHLKILPDNTGHFGIYWIGDIEKSDNVEVGWDSTNYFYDDNFNTWRKRQDAKEITPERQGLPYDGATASVIGDDGKINKYDEEVEKLINMGFDDSRAKTALDLHGNNMERAAHYLLNSTKNPITYEMDEQDEVQQLIGLGFDSLSAKTALDLHNNNVESASNYLLNSTKNPTPVEMKEPYEVQQLFNMGFDLLSVKRALNLHDNNVEKATNYLLNPANKFLGKGGKGIGKKRRKKVIKRRSITKRRRYKSNRRSAKRRRSKRRRSKRR